MKCDVVGKEDNYKYLLVLYTHHFSERFTFPVFFSCKSVFGQFTTSSSSFHSYSATSCEYDNRGSQRKISNFRYVAKLFYSKIGKSTNSA